MNHSIESNIDPYFSLWAIYWYDSSNPKEAFQFDKKFKELLWREKKYKQLQKKRTPTTEPKKEKQNKEGTVM